jgi:hypothetical protein
MYVPLAAGEHVYHQFVFMTGQELARSGARVLAYEECPYAIHSPAACGRSPPGWRPSKVPWNASSRCLRRPVRGEMSLTALRGCYELPAGFQRLGGGREAQ